MEEATGRNRVCSEASAWAGETPLEGLLTREAAGEAGPLLAPMEPDSWGEASSLCLVGAAEI